MDYCTSKITDIENAKLQSESEADYALWLKCQGTKIVLHRGRYWRSYRKGFYHSVHLMARMQDVDVSRPSPWCWGYCASLACSDNLYANATLPVHILRGISSYDLQALKSKRRNKVKCCRRHVQLVEFLEPGLLLEQGYDVVTSAHARTKYGKLPTKLVFQQQVKQLFSPRRGLVLGGLIDGRLGGFVIAIAVERTAYIEGVQLATEYLPTNVGTGLVFELIQACRRSGQIDEIVYGLHARENETLCRYKKEMSFTVENIPAKTWFFPLMGEVVRRCQSNAYYRLTGTDKRLPWLNRRNEQHVAGIDAENTERV